MHLKPAVSSGRSSLIVEMIVTSNVWAVAQIIPPTIESFKCYTTDRDFKPIEPTPWVYEGVQKVFIDDFANRDGMAAPGMLLKNANCC